MASTSDISKGLCMNYNNDVYQVVEFQHVKPGKGAAFVRTKLKSLTSGRVVDNTFPSGHKIDEVRVERRKYQYLYNDDMGYHFMNQETYNQVNLAGELIDNPGLLEEGATVEVLFDADTETPLTLDLPTHVELEITYTEPGVKGDTANSSSQARHREFGGGGAGPAVRQPGRLDQDRHALRGLHRAREKVGGGPVLSC